MPADRATHQHDRRTGQTTPHAINSRLTTGQRAFIQAVAEAHDVGLSEALRLILDAAMVALVEHDGSPVWDLVESFEPDPQWVARHGAES